MTDEQCKRTKVRIKGGNYYITQGRDFLTVTIPRENDKNNQRERIAVDEYCEWLSSRQITGKRAFQLLCMKIHDTRRQK